MNSSSIRLVVWSLIVWTATIMMTHSAVIYLRELWEEGFSWIRVTSVCAAGFLAVFGWLNIGFGWWHKNTEPHHGHCEKCDYNLAFNTSGICPECGHVVSESNGSNHG